jgi:hypothetical protein
MAILVIAPGASPASDATPSGPHRDAVLAAPGPSGGSGTAQERYSAVLIGPLEVGFTKAFLAKRDQRDRRIRGADVERMQRHYREVVSSKLAESEYAISDTPGLGVVRADAFLIDQVLDKRDWLVPATTSFRSAPKVRIVVFLRDSRSNELVDTVGLTLLPRSSRLMVDGPGAYWHYMRLVFDRIATRMRWALEDGTES